MNRLIGFNSHITSSHDVSSCGKRKLNHVLLTCENQYIRVRHLGYAASLNQ